MSRCTRNSCEAIGCPGHAPPTPAEKQRAARIDDTMREVLENQLAIILALKHMDGVPRDREKHLAERVEVTRDLLEGKS